MLVDLGPRASAHLLAVSGQNVMLLAALALPLLAARAPRACAPASRPSRPHRALRAARGRGAVAPARGGHGRWPGSLPRRPRARPPARTRCCWPRRRPCAGIRARRADPGWQLSFAAVAGILVLGMPLRRVPARRRDGARPRSLLRGRCVRGLADGVAITLAATLATAPLVAHHFGSVPLAGLPANVLALPAVAPAMWLGMAQGRARPADRRAGAGGRPARAGAAASAPIARAAGGHLARAVREQLAPTCPAGSCRSAGLAWVAVACLLRAAAALVAALRLSAERARRRARERGRRPAGARLPRGRRRRSLRRWPCSPLLVAWRRALRAAPPRARAASRSASSTSARATPR